MDGVTIGHPCCSVHNCREPLRSKRERFCPTHTNHSRLCRIKNCERPAEQQYRSCDDPEHRSLDLENLERGKSFFQLKRQAQRIRSGNIQDSVSLDNQTEEEALDELQDPEGGDDDDLDCDSKSPSGNVKLRAVWGRKQSHNEQLIVRPCGVIVARQTFYGSEGVAEAKVRN